MPQDDEREQTDIHGRRPWRRTMHGTARAAIAVWLAMLGVSTAGAESHGNHDIRQLRTPASKAGSGGAEFAQTLVAHVLRANAGDPWGYHHYDSFMAGSAHPRDVLPCLHKARDKGVTPAIYATGLARLSLGDKSSALGSRNEYPRRDLLDQRVRGLIDASRDGKLEIQFGKERKIK